MYRSLLVLALGMFAVGTDSFVIAGILPDLAGSLDVSTAAAGQLITAYALTYAALSPVMAAACARWPRKRLLITGLAVFTLGNVITAFVPVYGLVLAGRVLAGLGAAMITPTAVSTGSMLAAPEQRGRAIATVMTGLSAATALGSPLGIALSSVTGQWRATMVFLIVIGVLAAVGIAALLPPVPTPPPVGLRERLTPIADTRVWLTLATTVLVYTGLYTVYSYISVSFDRATGGSGATLALLLLIWGVAATLGTLSSGALVDRIGGRLMINTVIAIGALDFLLLPWSSKHLVTAIIALAIWGYCGWGALAPQTHRLIGIRPAAAPLLSGLASSSVYIGVSIAAAVGALGVTLVGPYHLGPFGAIFIGSGLVTAELAHRTIRHHTPRPTPVPVPIA
ncbi:MFS transporter [Nocardia sp. NPDC052566]|uniref:MFS transporter n=1 Tax=Nocardia sp. NPDC052566 TaxID=3364330 RepID=UPI0037CA8D51